MTFKIFILLPFCFAVLFQQTHSVVIQDLGGKDWTSYNQNKSIRVQSTVPGSIYTDLNQAEVLAGHLYDNFNDLDYRWVSYDNWTFERHFDVGESLLAKKRVFLTAHGLDTIGHVTLNGHVVGKVEDMFVRYRWEVRDWLKAKQNLIQVSFESAPLYATKKYLEAHPGKNHSECKPPNECHVNFIRKMPSSFSWDWGPAFPTQGIWRPMHLEGFNSAPIVRSISVDTIPKADNSWTLNTTIFLDGVHSSTQNVDLEFRLSGTVLTEEKSAHAVFDVNGEALVNLQISVPHTMNIKRWWPNGMGEQNLYEFKVSVHSGTESSSKSVKIGFRTVELSQEQLLHVKNTNKTAYAFYFKVNNVTFFAKGANWIPAHVLNEAITDDYLYELLLSTKLANMNMLRVWGGGIYEQDSFYEYCDQLGLMVIQDMMFASATYPGDDHFLGLVGTEMRQQIRRLQHHPSIVLWAGNNEDGSVIESGWFEEVLSQGALFRENYIKLTINVTKGICTHEDHLRPFVSSSPSKGIAEKTLGYIAKTDALSGDMHWYIFGDAWNWHQHPRAKFVSEYGFQSLSSVHLLEKHLDKEWLVFPFTKGINHRQRSNGDALMHMIKEQFALPKSGGIEALNDYVYISQIFQAVAIKIESEFYRRDRKLLDNGEGMTMGALYWQLNDIWPGFSWSSLEFGGKWKMLHYYVKNFFDNLTVDVYEDGDALKVVIVRDDHEPKSAKLNLTIEVFDWSSSTALHSEHLEVSAEPFSVNTVYEHNTKDLLTKSKCPDRSHCLITVSISSSDHKVHKSNFLLLSRVKEIRGLSKPNIKLHLTGPVESSLKHHQWEYALHLQTDHIAPFVWLDVSDSKVGGATFSDNGFILTKQATLTLKSKTKLTSVEMSNLITIKSLKDVNFE